jgi:hypothetical protein
LPIAEQDTIVRSHHCVLPAVVPCEHLRKTVYPVSQNATAFPSAGSPPPPYSFICPRSAPDRIPGSLSSFPVPPNDKSPSPLQSPQLQAHLIPCVPQNCTPSPMQHYGPICTGSEGVQIQPGLKGLIRLTRSGARVKNRQNGCPSCPEHSGTSVRLCRKVCVFTCHLRLSDDGLTLPALPFLLHLTY